MICSSAESLQRFDLAVQVEAAASGEGDLESGGRSRGPANGARTISSSFAWAARERWAPSPAHVSRCKRVSLQDLQQDNWNIGLVLTVSALGDLVGANGPLKSVCSLL